MSLVVKIKYAVHKTYGGLVNKRFAQLSHVYDRFLDTASSRRDKNQNWVPGLW